VGDLERKEREARQQLTRKKGRGAPALSLAVTTQRQEIE